MAQWSEASLFALEEVAVQVQIPTVQVFFVFLFFSFIVFLHFGLFPFIPTADPF